MAQLLNESPSLPYGPPNLANKSDFGPFLCCELTFSQNPRISGFQLCQIVSAFMQDFNMPVDFSCIQFKILSKIKARSKPFPKGLPTGPQQEIWMQQRSRHNNSPTLRSTGWDNFPSIIHILSQEVKHSYLHNPYTKQ